MRLKSIKVFGFKSFADKLEIDVDGNLVAVVGPNGCGKSNIVDAIQWALGEPSPKNLRAAQSTDVIFNGSAKRKALGYAEVSLVFDNEDGTLPIPTTEVVVTRRLDRKGESAYYINRQGCRLKDIYELFADSGLGRTGYAIVSQKDIDAALSAPPAERRIWIDEAAGVQRYRTRKIEALKRLESAVTHLQRVTDVIAEIENQREPLREQAEAARIYKQALASLREVESGLLLKEADDLEKEILRLETSIVDKRRQADSMRKDAEEAEVRSNELGQRIADLEGHIDNLRGVLQTAITSLERAQSKRALAEQRLVSLDELEAHSGKEAEAAKARVERARAAIQAAEKELTEEQKSIELLLTVISGSSEEAKEFAEELERAENKLASARRGEVERIQEEARVSQASERRAAVAREFVGAKDALPEVRAGEQKAEEAVSAARANLEDLRGQEKQLAASRDEENEKLHKVEDERRKTLAQRASLEGRIQGLRATLESFEGLPAGARAVLQAAKDGKLSGDFIPASSAIHVPEKYAIAIESALGASAGDLITSDSKHAKQAIALLKSEGLGRATFLAADLINPRPRNKDLDALAKKGAIGVAADLVRFDEKHRLAVELLLGGVVVVENLDAATKLAREPGYRKIATLEGELVFGGGALSGGRSAKQTAGPIRISAQLEEAEREHAKLDGALQGLEAQAAEITRSHLAQVERGAELREKMHEKEEELTEAVHWLAAVREERAATERAIDKLSAEIAGLDDLIARGVPELSSEAPEELESERNRLLAIAAAKAADAEQARRALEEAREREAAAKARVAHAQTDLEHALQHDQVRESRIKNLGEDRETHRSTVAEAEAEIRSLAASRSEAERNLEEAQDKRRDLLEESFQSAEDAKSWREAARALEDIAYGDDIQRARAETKRSAALSRLLEEYSVDEEDAKRQAPLVELPPDAQRVASRLRREIRELGDVNIGAIEAYERLTERYETLTTQREDILASKAELDKSIAELDRLTRGAFNETFEKVNGAFGEMFSRLFGGGEARLELTEPDNILETGVDVHVQIPGKKTQRLELLSGGERALSACAFLFALFKVKPSPLCVLDELDAPLDGRNVERYVELLKRFSEDSQYIVITHNPTTIEAAPIWFGVTMQEPGVSTVIPYRVPPALGTPTQLEASKN